MDGELPAVDALAGARLMDELLGHCGRDWSPTSVCYHPLFVFNPEGDCLAAKLRPGNVHSADGWDEVLLPIIDRYRARGQTVVVRADAAFALPALYEALERRGVRYAIRLPANDVLERRIEDLLTRPRGRPSQAPLVRYRSFDYQAASRSRPRRVIAKVEHHLGELFPRVGFIVTTLTGTNRDRKSTRLNSSHSQISYAVFCLKKKKKKP